MTVYYVYVDRTDEAVPRPYYVGKGTAHRVRDLTRNEVHCSIRRKYGLLRTIEFETYDENEALKKEEELIREYRTYVHGGRWYWGANLTETGSGKSSGTSKQWTDERRRAQSLRMKLNNPSKQPNSDETRQRKSLGQKRRYMDPEERSKTSQSIKQAWENKACAF